jgi:hypothetical protein
MKFIFWNIVDNDTIGETIGDLIKHEKPDLLLLAETKLDDTFIMTHGMKYICGIEKTSFGINKKMRLYSRNIKIIPVSSHGDGEIMTCSIEIDTQGIKEHYLIFGCHMVSKSTIKNAQLRLKRFIKYREYIETTEKEFTSPPRGEIKNFKGSIVFGDFNTNPFETAFTDSLGLLALDVRSPLPKKLKNVSFFINPMFSLIGNFNFNREGKQAAPGTFFHKKNIEDTDEHFWNILDGMIFRPSIETKYDLENPLEVITSIKDEFGNIIHYLFDYSNHRIDAIKYSDHLPIKFNFKI